MTEITIASVPLFRALKMPEGEFLVNEEAYNN
jgi:hypothetical protein